jgi:hypothetical protein
MRSVAADRAVARAARILAQAIVIGISIALVVFAVSDWKLSDASAYWNAGMRLREGAPLYPAVTDVEASDVYRYAPWFAWLAVPLTFLPPPVAGALWSVVLVGASAFAIWPMARGGAWLQAIFFGAVLVGISAIGNAQPVIVAMLVHGVERRGGPLWIALAASLKAVPLAFALVYLGRRQWVRFVLSCALTAALVAPALFYGVGNYVTDAGQAALLFGVPALYVGVVGVAVVVTTRLAQSPWAWLAAGVTAALALPRFFVYDVTFLVAGAQAEISYTGRKVAGSK